MGYFNIFYKLTRIIDFFTRKRNRKFVLALCLIVGIVFFSPNVANADFTSTDSNTLTYMQVDIAGIRNYLQGWISTYLVLIQSNTNTTNTRLTDIRGDLANQMTVLSTFATQLSNIRQDLIDMNSTLDHVDNDIHDLLNEVEDLQQQIDDCLTACNKIIYDIEYYGELNHADMQEIQNMLHDYLYGDADLFPYGFKQVNGIVARNGVFELNSDYNTIYFEAKENEYYYVQFSKVTINPAPYMVRYGYVDSIPSVSSNYIDYNTWTQPYNDYLELVGNGTGKYIYISYAKGSVSNFLIESTYNQGQEMGIYGGLTNIEQTTIYQGEQTRDTIQEESEATRNTITNTTYNQSDVNVNTSAIDSVSSSEIQGLFTTIFNNFNSAITGGTDSIVIPLPHGRSIGII